MKQPNLHMVKSSSSIEVWQTAIDAASLSKNIAELVAIYDFIGSQPLPFDYGFSNISFPTERLSECDADDLASLLDAILRLLVGPDPRKEVIYWNLEILQFCLGFSPLREDYSVPNLENYFNVETHHRLRFETAFIADYLNVKNKTKIARTYILNDVGKDGDYLFLEEAEFLFYQEQLREEVRDTATRSIRSGQLNIASQLLTVVADHYGPESAPWLASQLHINDEQFQSEVVEVLVDLDACKPYANEITTLFEESVARLTSTKNDSAKIIPYSLISLHNFLIDAIESIGFWTHSIEQTMLALFNATSDIRTKSKAARAILRRMPENTAVCGWCVSEYNSLDSNDTLLKRVELLEALAATKDHQVLELVIENLPLEPSIFYSAIREYGDLGIERLQTFLAQNPGRSQACEVRKLIERLVTQG